MTLTNFPAGITSFGIPALGSGAISIPARNGKVLFVNGSGGFGDGSAPDSALSTITLALAQCTAGAGDTIFVYPGTYAENLAVSVDGVSIIGALIGGFERPNIVPASGTAITLTGQGVTLRHLRFSSADNDVAVVNSNGNVIIDCVLDGTAGMGATKGCLRFVGATSVATSASDNLVQACVLRNASVGAGMIFQHALLAAGGEATSNNQILACQFYNNGVDLLSAVNTNGGGAGIFLNLLVKECAFLTVGAAYVYMSMAQGAAGDKAVNSCLICGCFFSDEAIIAAQILLATQANAMFVGNYDCIGLINGAAFN